MNNPGQYLKMIREKRGLGVKAVYSKTGVGDSTIRRIEEGKTKFPPAAQLKTLAMSLPGCMREVTDCGLSFLSDVKSC